MPSVTRALGQVAIGVQLRRDRREAALAPTQMGHMMQQVQALVSGRAGADAQHAEDVVVQWPYPFVNAQAFVDTMLDTPHFNYGSELLTPLPVILHPHVTSWIQNDDEWYIGANMRVTAWMPGATKSHPFEAILHLSFTGFACPIEDEDDPNL